MVGRVNIFSLYLNIMPSEQLLTLYIITLIGHIHQALNSVTDMKLSALNALSHLILI